MGQSNPKHKHLGREWTGSSPEKDLRVLVEEKLNMTEQRAITAQKSHPWLQQEQCGHQVE